MALELRLWKYGEDDRYIDSFLRVRSIAHKEALKTEEWFHWKFEQSPYGKAIMAMAFDGDVVAGCVAFGYGKFVYQGKEYKCALSYDTFVNADYQGHGLFKKLIKLAEEESVNQGVELLYNFPNTNSITGFRHMGWEYVAGISVYKLRLRNVLKVLTHIKDLRSVFVSDESNIANLRDISVAPFVQKVDDSGDNCVRYVWSAEYLKWRFFTIANARYFVLNDNELFGIARVGNRGVLKEAQVLLVQRHDGDKITGVDYKRFVKKLNAEVKPDVIGVSCSTKSDVFDKLCCYIKVPNHSNFTYKVLGNEVQQGCDFALNSIDYHTY